MWVLNLRPDGTVHEQAKWDPGRLGPSSALVDGDRFASAIASFDLSSSGGDPMLAIGAPGDDAGISGGGAVWLARLSVSGEIATAWKISAHDPPLSDIVPGSAFGSSVASMGDLDGDGLTELAVGAPVDEAVWIVFLDAMDGVNRAMKITVGSSGFGSAVTSVDDLDGDGRRELVVGAPQDGSDFILGGALWLLFLNSDGSVLRHTKLNSKEGGFSVGLLPRDHFGSSVAAIGDLDLDGISELAVGATGDDQLGPDRGSVWLLSLSVIESSPESVIESSRDSVIVRSQEKIFDGERRAPSTSYSFGSSITALPDLNGDGIADLAVGATGADDGAMNAGATWLLALDGAVSPRLLHASATSRTSLTLEFSERLLAASAEIESAYDVSALPGVDSSVPVVAAGLQPDGHTVHLILADSLKESSYRVVASGIMDESGTPLAPDGNSAELTVPPVSFQISIAAMEYRGFGLSLLPYDTDPSWIFRTLGERDSDRGWRASHWSPKDGVYVQVGTPLWPLNEIVPGLGYWVISRAQEVLQVGGFPLPEEPYEISLLGGSGDPEPPAWNQIANPFPFPVLVGDLKVTDGSRTVALTAPENDLSSRYLLDGSTGEYVELGAAQCLRTHTAYWIEKIAEGPLQLVVPASPVDENACASFEGQLSLPPRAEWVAMLTATQGARRSQPLLLGAGRDLEQAHQLRARAAPPPPGDPVPVLYVEETSRGRLNGRYTKVFRDAARPVDWHVCLETPVVPGQVRLEISAIGLDNVPMSWQDPLTGSKLPIASESVWTLAAARSPRCYVLQIGSPRDAQAETSSRQRLRPPSPNPFVESTGFFFDAQAPAEIRADVYDLAGRHVRTLARRTTSAGESVLVWDGKDVRGRPVASGIYLVRQRIDDEAERTFRVAKLR
jgi:hypothetical protein